MFQRRKDRVSFRAMATYSGYRKRRCLLRMTPPVILVCIGVTAAAAHLAAWLV